MFWTDWGEHPKIERAELDGSNRVVIVDTAVKWPNGLVIDQREQKIYWVDTTLDKIEVMDMDGHHRKVLLDSGLGGVFGIGVLGDRIYWTDWEQSSLESANKHSGKERNLLKKLPDLMGLQAVNLDLPLGMYLIQLEPLHCHVCFFAQNNLKKMEEHELP